MSAWAVPGLAVALLLGPASALAAAPPAADLTSHWAGIAALAVFFLAYALVISEEALHLRKSKPVIVAAGIIWVLVALAYSGMGDTRSAEAALQHDLLQFAELFLFLLAAMTYINTMQERGVFDALRAWLITRGFSLRQIFWITGALAFSISPVADNLTTALLMVAVVIAVAGANRQFVVLCCINIVVAANAGGAFSPFGDITTLMVWQAGLVDFWEFFALFLPSLTNWLVTAGLLSLGLVSGEPEGATSEARLKHGALVVVALFILTIIMAVSAYNLLHLPPVIGMMTGLGFLKLFGYYLQLRERSEESRGGVSGSAPLGTEAGAHGPASHYDIYAQLQRAEWDTLMFFYGIILCVGGLGAFGYLAVGSEFLYQGLGPLTANVLVGFASAVVDNIPIMFAVLEMNPDMSLGHWLLVTLTAGVGGSLLSIGSAAGVAVMGQARGVYTFRAHLKWSWAVLLGYLASIGVHLLVNADLFS